MLAVDSEFVHFAFEDCKDCLSACAEDDPFIFDFRERVLPGTARNEMPEGDTNLVGLS